MQTAQQIVSLATQAAKCPGFLQQAGQLLNARLIQIALDQDLDIIRRTTTFNTVVGKGYYSLPTNYLRSREVFYSVNGDVFTCTQRSIEEGDTYFTGPGNTDYPDVYWTDIAQSPPLIWLYPYPSIVTTVTVRYMDNLVEITNPETSSVIPWFQDQLLLYNMLVEDLMSLTDDDRAESFFAKNDEKYRRYLQMDNDKDERTLIVKRDPRQFRSGSSYKPTKKQGW